MKELGKIYEVVVGLEAEDGYKEITITFNHEHLIYKYAKRFQSTQLDRYLLVTMQNIEDAIAELVSKKEIADLLFYDMLEGETFILELSEFNASIPCTICNTAYTENKIFVHTIWRGFHTFRKGVGQKIIRITRKGMSLFTYEKGGVYVEWNPSFA